MRGVVVALALTAGSCTTPTLPPEALSVAQLLDRAPSLVGEKVTVVGFISSCVPLSCAIGDQREVWGTNNKNVSIGAAPQFDQNVRKMEGRRIVIRAEFTGRCVDLDPNDDVITLCTDRGDALINPELVYPVSN